MATSVTSAAFSQAPRGRGLQRHAFQVAYLERRDHAGCSRHASAA
jgi:hypothetical protein